MAGPQLNFGGTTVVNPYESLINVLGKNGALAQTMIAGDEAKRHDQDRLLRQQQLDMQREAANMTKQEHQMKLDDRAANTAFFNALNAPQTMQSATMTNLASAKPELFKGMELTPEEQAATAPGGVITPEMKASIDNKMAQQAKIAQVASVLPTREDMLGTTSEQYMKAMKGLNATPEMQKMLVEQRAADRQALAIAQKENSAQTTHLTDKLEKLYLDQHKVGSGDTVTTDNGNIINMSTKTGANMQYENNKRVGDGFTGLVKAIDEMKTGTGKDAKPLAADLRDKVTTQAKNVYLGVVAAGGDPELAKTIALAKSTPQYDGSKYYFFGDAQYKLDNANLTPAQLNAIEISKKFEDNKLDAKLTGASGTNNGELKKAYGVLLDKVGTELAVDKQQKAQLLLSPEERRVATAGGLLERELKGLSTASVPKMSVQSTEGLNTKDSTSKVDPKLVNTVIDSLVKKGWTEEQAMGLTSDLIRESNLDHKSYVADGKEQGSDGGRAFGIAQWRGSRQTDLLNFAKKDKLQDVTLDDQINFFHHEQTMGNEQKAGKALVNALTAEDAAKSNAKHYERPKDLEGAYKKSVSILGDVRKMRADEVSKYKNTADIKPEDTVTGKNVNNVITDIDAFNSETARNIAKKEQSKYDSLLAKPFKEWTTQDRKLALSKDSPLSEPRKRSTLFDMFGDEPRVLKSDVQTKDERVNDSKVLASMPEEGLTSSSLDIVPITKIAGPLLKSAYEAASPVVKSALSYAAKPITNIRDAKALDKMLMEATATTKNVKEIDALQTAHKALLEQMRTGRFGQGTVKGTTSVLPDLIGM